MSNFDFDGGSDNAWEDRGDLAWNEFDWERYLREQDEAVQRYLHFYEANKGDPERIDKVAEQMHWGDEDWTDDTEDEDDEAEDDDTPGSEEDVYTLHKNPIYISTKAIYLGLHRSWEELATDSAKVPQGLAIRMLAALQRGEDHAVQAIHALDFGDYAMAVSLFKRALSALNDSLTLLNHESALRQKAVAEWRADALPSLFDLREIWLRVMSECREELERPLDDES